MTVSPGPRRSRFERALGHIYAVGFGRALSRARDRARSFETLARAMQRAGPHGKGRTRPRESVSIAASSRGRMVPATANSMRPDSTCHRVAWRRRARSFRSYSAASTTIRAPASVPEPLHVPCLGSSSPGRGAFALRHARRYPGFASRHSRSSAALAVRQSAHRHPRWYLATVPCGGHPGLRDATAAS